MLSLSLLFTFISPPSPHIFFFIFMMIHHEGNYLEPYSNPNPNLLKGVEQSV